MRGQEYVGEEPAEDGVPRYLVKRLTCPSGQVRPDRRSRGAAVRVVQPAEELRGGELVVLRADGLDDVRREHAAHLGGVLEAEPPRQGGQEAGPERVADAGRLDRGDVRGRRPAIGSWPLRRIRTPSLPSVVTWMSTRDRISSADQPVFCSIIATRTRWRTGTPRRRSGRGSAPRRRTPAAGSGPR